MPDQYMLFQCFWSRDWGWGGEGVRMERGGGGWVGVSEQGLKYNNHIHVVVE